MAEINRGHASTRIELTYDTSQILRKLFLSQQEFRRIRWPIELGDISALRETRSERWDALCVHRTANPESIDSIDMFFRLDISNQRYAIDLWVEKVGVEMNTAIFWFYMLFNISSGIHPDSLFTISDFIISPLRKFRNTCPFNPGISKLIDSANDQALL
jgi:hypothetical protein